MMDKESRTKLLRFAVSSALLSTAPASFAVGCGSREPTHNVAPIQEEPTPNVAPIEEEPEPEPVIDPPTVNTEPPPEENNSTTMDESPPPRRHPLPTMNPGPEPGPEGEPI